MKHTALAAAIAAIGSSACCVLPMTFMLFGLGGSWLGVFGKAAAWAPAAVAAAFLATCLSWLLSWRQRKLRQQAPVLVWVTLLNFLAWAVWANEAAINDWLILQM